MPRTYEPVPSRAVAFLGLGVMGYPMAGHLAAAGHKVTVFNRTAAKSAEWVKTHGGASAATPAAAASGAELVFACVGNDDDLRLQIKLHSHRARGGDLTAGTEHLHIV